MAAAVTGTKAIGFALAVVVCGCTAASRGKAPRPAAGVVPPREGVSAPTPTPDEPGASSKGNTSFSRLLEKLATTPRTTLAPEPSDENRDLIAALREQELDAEENQRGVVVTLPDVLFEFGSSDLTFGAKRKIRRIADTVLRLAGGRRLDVEGHTDSIGAELYNQALSERRAEAVARQLRNAGVPAALVTAKGFGEAYPVAPNEYPDGADNPAGRARNRRVEIVVEN